MNAKEYLGAISVIIAFVSHAIYVMSILRRKTKPHIFSWIVWGLSEAIACAAQISRDAGAGAWATGFDAAITFVIVAFVYRQGEKNITRGDWLAFTGALLALPLWWLTKDPLGSVILLSIIDISAYYPTFRKSWQKPEEEAIFIYAIGGGQFALALCAMTSYSLVTSLYPACIATMNAVLIAILVWRRAVLGRVHGDHS